METCQFSALESEWNAIVEQLQDTGNAKLAGQVLNQLPGEATNGNDVLRSVWCTEDEFDALESARQFAKGEAVEETDLIDDIYEVASYLHNESVNCSDADFAEKLRRVAEFLDRQG